MRDYYRTVSRYCRISMRYHEQSYRVMNTDHLVRRYASMFSAMDEVGRASFIATLDKSNAQYEGAKRGEQREAHK